MPRNTKYRAEHDGLQWTLYRESDGKRKETGETYRKETTVGYFPRFSQVVARMAEHMIADKLDGSFSEETLLEAVSTAQETFAFVNTVSREQVKVGVDG